MSIRKWLPFVLFLYLGVVAAAQNIGDQRTAGFTDSRTYLNSDMKNFRPPLQLFQTIDLTATTAADQMLVFENALLIGEAGDQTTYRLYDRSNGGILWTNSFAAPASRLDFVPAFSDDLVILGSASTTTVRAVQVSSGTALWSDSTVGGSEGRHPVLTNGLAIYHGQDNLKAVNASDNQLFWQFPTSTAAAPVSVSGNRVYMLQAGGRLFSFNLRTGAQVWSTTAQLPDGVGSDGTNLIATEKYVFVNNPVNGLFGAVLAGDGSVAWGGEPVPAFANPGIALAYDHLYVFTTNDQGQATVQAHDPDNGTLIWEFSDPSAAQAADALPKHAVIANNVIYFYNSSGRIRALDAFSGNPLWSIEKEDVRGLSAADDALFVLLADKVEVYQRAHQIYFAQIADGEGQSTLFTLSSLSDQQATGTIHFIDDNGNPVELQVEGQAAPSSSVDFTVSPNSSTSIQTTGESAAIKVGWARVESDQPLRGSSIFQFELNNIIQFEAGVGDSPATGFANVFVTRVASAAGTEFDTGIAIANPFGTVANVTLRLRSNATGEVLETANVTVDSNGHIARFLNQFFLAELVPLGIEASLEIESDIPVVSAALRTQGGFQMSSYPVGQRSR